MLVNNETGAVTDISAVSRILKEEGSAALLHTDAVQAFMKLDFTPKSLGADLISISGHKVHAPKGIGALYIRKGLRLRPYIMGGAQEDGRRAGTEAMPQIAAFGEAARIAKAGLRENIAHMAALKAAAADGLRAAIPELRMIETAAPHILSVSLPGFRSEVLMNFLEAREIYVSRSSACKKGARSHVLESIGMESRLIDGALRIGFCRYNTAEDVTALVDGLRDAHRTLAHR
jgi:cysteine desulfurase